MVDGVLAFDVLLAVALSVERVAVGLVVEAALAAAPAVPAAELAEVPVRGLAHVTLGKKGHSRMMSTLGRGAISDQRKGGWVNSVPYQQGVRHRESQNVCRHHLWMAPKQEAAHKNAWQSHATFSSPSCTRM